MVQGEPWGLHGFFSTFRLACSNLRQENEEVWRCSSLSSICWDYVLNGKCSDWCPVECVGRYHCGVMCFDWLPLWYCVCVWDAWCVWVACSLRRVSRLLGVSIDGWYDRMPYAADEIADVLRNSVVFVDLNSLSDTTGVPVLLWGYNLCTLPVNGMFDDRRGCNLMFKIKNFSRTFHFSHTCQCRDTNTNLICNQIFNWVKIKFD